ncbi:hypothetical protein [Chitinimonas sp.]|uniref:hypothetical protein n=1 Tax=Chitinimonas sp. TaxID=1934313 RepID=UPI0035B210CE
MVFSFFKKKDAEPDQATPRQPRIVQPKGAAAKADAAGQGGVDASVAEKDKAPIDFGTTLGPSTISGVRIDVVESSDVLSVAMEQAAISFANDQIDDAIAILAADVLADGRGSIDTWLALFDLYQMRGRHAEFDELALRFVVAFERSAPVWQQQDPGSKPAVPAQAKAGGPHFTFQSKLTADNIEKQLEQLEKAVVSGAAVRVDFGRVELIESAAAAAIVQRWAKFRKKKVRFLPAGGPALTERLKGLIEVMRRNDEEAPYWLLLMEIYQLLGLQEDFENAAVDYAVTFEVSPPSWDVSAKTKTAAEVAAEDAKLRAESPMPEPVEDAYCFEGVIVGASEASFQPLLDYAADHEQVLVDFSKVARVDFVSAGALMNVLVNLTAQSKHATLIGANELIVALFRIMGIADIARIIRKK